MVSSLDRILDQGTSIPVGCQSCTDIDQEPVRNTGIVEYSGLKTTSKYIVTIVSAMLPALSILGLYFEKVLLRRIYIMLGLTLTFAAALTFGTSARRIEVFSATAAQVPLTLRFSFTT